MTPKTGAIRLATLRLFLPDGGCGGFNRGDARAKSARANYAMMGGGSPLLSETENQRAALKTR